MVTPLEAFADAIMTYEGWRPGSRSYRNRNPGNLRSSPLATSTDGAGYAIFPSLSVGYMALCQDISDKAEGKTATGLGPSSNLLDFFNVYAPSGDANTPIQYAYFVAARLKTVLGGVVGIYDTLGGLLNVKAAT